MKKDCSNILVYKEEMNRMCQYLDSCRDCVLDDDTCNDIDELSPEHIEIVQKWSDEHPVKTRQSELLKIFPEIDINPSSILNIRPCDIVGRLKCTCDDYENCTECKREFWSQEVELV